MSDIATQYRIITAGAGWIERSVRGRLRFEGADRVPFLQALVTNDVASLKPGSGAYAAYLTPQGRMITDLHLFIRANEVIADVPAAAAATLAETLDHLIFSEDVRVSDQSAALRQITVIGARAPEMIARAFSVPEEALSGLPVWSQLDAGSGFVVRTDEAEEGSWDVVLPAASIQLAIGSLESAGVAAISSGLTDALRIDAGRPLFGVDMTNDTIPLEAGILDRAISQTKGCYVGQEVIIRVLHRGAGRVAKRLMQMTCDAPDAAVPPPGSPIQLDSKDVGVVTSAAWSPRTERIIALGYIAREAAEPGRSVRIGSDTPATITKSAS